MGKWVRIPCETCDETGKVCDACGGDGEVYCDCDDNDACEKCNGCGTIKCNECVRCSACEGQGYNEVFIDECPECGGGRTVECDCTGGLGSHAADEDCLACGGDGNHTCPACNGTGYDMDNPAINGIDIARL